MLDLTSIDGFEWDEGNALKSLDKHKVTQAEVEQIFARQPLVSADTAHSQHERRYQALGETMEGRRLHVAFTLRESGKKIRIISTRDMSRKERAIYAEKS